MESLLSGSFTSGEDSTDPVLEDRKCLQRSERDNIEVKKQQIPPMDTLVGVPYTVLFTLLTHDCSAIHPSCLIVKFADDTAVVGRIANNDESDYRQEVEHLEGWCRQNNLCINVKKTKEMIVDFRRGRHLPSPLYIGGTAVEVVSSFRRLRRSLASWGAQDLLLLGSVLSSCLARLKKKTVSGLFVRNSSIKFQTVVLIPRVPGLLAFKVHKAKSIQLSFVAVKRWLAVSLEGSN
ncbi:hypothetical protein L3Q82_002968 [Scortum barcoo]|uniref:Uncharacterized protein n=1 Tax=Scortum barcoo TaxID=214431 RepID=A0ACB8VR39_9TELE|nr:hypothetical protein L3Q82_002968 [Scortum barcoo]